MSSHQKPSRFGRFLLFTGTVLFLLAAYQQALSNTPLRLFSEAAAQIAASFLLLCLGVTLTASKLKPITWQAELRKHTIDQSDSRLGFANVHHRGTLLFREN